MGAPLETDRLLLAEWSDSDLALLARLSADPRVVRYVGDGQLWSPERAADVSGAMVKHWRANGFGWRVATEKESGEAVGFIALNYLGEGAAGLDANEFEIGWWLDPRAWGHGFASEGARAVAREAFERLGAPSIVARLQPDNLASARVATQIGMEHELDTTGRFGEPVAVYRGRRVSRERGAAGSRRYSPHQLRQHPPPIPPRDRLELGSQKTARPPGRPAPSACRRLAERGRDGGPVEVGAERRRARSRSDRPHSGRGGDQIDRGVGVISTIPPQERAGEDDPHQPAGCPDRVELRRR